MLGVMEAGCFGTSVLHPLQSGMDGGFTAVTCVLQLLLVVLQAALPGQHVSGVPCEFWDCFPKSGSASLVYGLNAGSQEVQRRSL